MSLECHLIILTRREADDSIQMNLNPALSALVTIYEVIDKVMLISEESCSSLIQTTLDMLLLTPSLIL